MNTSAIEILHANQDRINWNMISKNPAIFELRADPILIAILKNL
jgi:hypothetical protein